MNIGNTTLVKLRTQESDSIETSKKANAVQATVYGHKTWLAPCVVPVFLLETRNHHKRLRVHNSLSRN